MSSLKSYASKTFSIHLFAFALLGFFVVEGPPSSIAMLHSKVAVLLQRICLQFNKLRNSINLVYSEHGQILPDLSDLRKLAQATYLDLDGNQMQTSFVCLRNDLHVSHLTCLMYRYNYCMRVYILNKIRERDLPVNV